MDTSHTCYSVNYVHLTIVLVLMLVTSNHIRKYNMQSILYILCTMEPKVVILYDLHDNIMILSYIMLVV